MLYLLCSLSHTLTIAVVTKLAKCDPCYVLLSSSFGVLEMQQMSMNVNFAREAAFNSIKAKAKKVASQW